MLCMQLCKLSPYAPHCWMNTVPHDRSIPPCGRLFVHNSGQPFNVGLFRSYTIITILWWKFSTCAQYYNLIFVSIILSHGFAKSRSFFKQRSFRDDHPCDTIELLFIVRTETATRVRGLPSVAPHHHPRTLPLPLPPPIIKNSLVIRLFDGIKYPKSSNPNSLSIRWVSYTRRGVLRYLLD